MDSVNHPEHYNLHPTGVEAIDIIEHMSFNSGCAIKYIWRAESGVRILEDWERDMRKAIWYLEREIGRKKKPRPVPLGPPPEMPPEDISEESPAETSEPPF